MLRQRVHAHGTLLLHRRQHDCTYILHMHAAKLAKTFPRQGNGQRRGAVNYSAASRHPVGRITCCIRSAYAACQSAAASNASPLRTRM